MEKRRVSWVHIINHWIEAINYILAIPDDHCLRNISRKSHKDKREDCDLASHTVVVD